MTKGIIPAFSTGVIAPELTSSIELEKARAGLYKCENMIVDALGGVKNRPGIQFVVEAYDKTKLSRLITFQFNTEQAYMLEFADSIMRIIKDGAIVKRDLVDSAVYKWTASGSGANEYYLELLAGGNPGLVETAFVLENGSKMTNGSAGSLTAGQYDHFDNDTLGYTTFYVRLSDNADPDSKADGYVQIPVEVVTPYPIAKVATLEYTQSADTIYIVHPSYNIRKITRTSHVDWTITEITQMDGPYLAEEEGDRLITINATESAPWTLKASSAIFTDIEIGDPFRLGFPVPGDTALIHWTTFYVDGVSSDTQILATPIQDEQNGIVYEEIINWSFLQGIHFWEDHTKGVSGGSTITYDDVNKRCVLEQGSGDTAIIQQTVLTFSQIKHKLIVDVDAISGISPMITIKIGTTSLGAETFGETFVADVLPAVINIDFIPTATDIFISIDTAGDSGTTFYLLSLRNATYKWTLSTDPDEYYVELAGGGDPGLTEPFQVLEDGTPMSKDAPGVLDATEWGWGDIDSLGYNTVYVRLADSSDPDGKTQDWVEAKYNDSQDGDIVEIGSISLQKRDNAAGTTQEQNTNDWRLPAWNANHGYPAKAIINEQSLHLANNASQPQTIWKSKTGNFEDFGFNTPTLDTDSISFNPPTPQINGIEWLALQNGLNVGTAGELWKVFAASGGVITPTDVNIKVDSAIGSLALNPLVIGNSIMMTPRGSEAVVEATSSFEASGYIPRDLSILAYHLFEDRRIIRWAYAKAPDSIIWCVLDNGQLLGLTYRKEYDIWAWHTHTYPIGEGFKDIVVIPNSSDDNIDDVYFIVNHSIDGVSPIYHIGKLNKRITSQTAAFGLSASGSPYDYKFLDSALTYDVPLTITNITTANPAVVTSAAHGLSNDDFIKIQNAKGMTGVNNIFGNTYIKYKIKNKTANTFELWDENDAPVNGLFLGGTYLGSGEARKMVTIVSGLDHLETRVVTVLADGSIEEGLTVSGGSITLSDAASFVHVGLPYVPEIETLDLEAIAETGSTQGRLKAVTIADIYFKDSRGAEIATSNNPDTYWSIDFKNESYGQYPPDLFTGSKETKAIISDYDKSDRIKIRGLAGLPIHIKRIIPDVDYGG